MLESFIQFGRIFQIETPLRGAVVLDNLGCYPVHEYGALRLHPPGHVGHPPLLQGVVGAGPVAGGGAELLAAVLSIMFTAAATQQEAILGVGAPWLHQTGGQQARGGGGGEEHLRGL